MKSKIQVSGGNPKPPQDLNAISNYAGESNGKQQGVKEQNYKIATRYSSGSTVGQFGNSSSNCEGFYLLQWQVDARASETCPTRVLFQNGSQP